MTDKYFKPAIISLIIILNSACPDSTLTTLTNQASMEQAGWVINVGYSMDERFATQCGANTWYGFSDKDKIGDVQATLNGYGDGGLNYGNCHGKGVVNVFLNNALISSANANVKLKTVAFSYRQGDVLKITEEDSAIIKLNSFEIQCTGIKYI